MEAAGKLPNLYLDSSGETFEFQTSAKSGDGVFRFRWTLAAGKKGPPEHVHDDEAETFHVVSGTLRIWIDGTSRDLGPGDTVTVEPGARHRFLNPGSDPVIVHVSLNGTRMEDALVPLAIYANGRRKMNLRAFAVVMAHLNAEPGSQPPGKLGRVFMRGFTGMFRLVVKPRPRAPAW